MTISSSGSWAAQQRRLVHVSGPGAQAYLQSQLSQDLLPLEDSQACWAFLLTPEGRLGFLVRVIKVTAADWLILGPRDREDELLSRVKRFAIRVQASFELETWWHLISGPQGEVASGLWELPSQLKTLGCTEWLSRDEPLLSGERCDYEDAIRHHLVLPIIDDNDIRDSMMPAELGASMISQTVSFTKGCYPGQELVARVDARGVLPPHPVVGIESSQPLVENEEIFVGDDPVGHVLSDLVLDSNGSWRGLGVVKRAAIGNTLTCRGVALTSLALG